MDELDRLLTQVKQRARGWMEVAVYRRLYETAACGGTIVEIGTFRGAATIAMALGARARGADFRVLTADLLRPGVGLEGETPEAKQAALRETLAEFGVAGSVRFVHGTAADLVAAEDPQYIRLLLLDGGGKIEEDLALLWTRLAPGAAIVIDDIDGAVVVERSWRRARVNQKHLLSRLLVDIFVGAGILIDEGRIGSTGWFRKGEANPSPDAIRLMALPAYHRLVAAEIDASEFGLPRAAARGLAVRAPWLRRLYRRVRP